MKNQLVQWLQPRRDPQDPLLCQVCTRLKLDTVDAELCKPDDSQKNIQIPVIEIAKQAETGCGLCQVLTEIVQIVSSFQSAEDRRIATVFERSLWVERNNMSFFYVKDSSGHNVTPFAGKHPFEVCFMPGAQRIFHAIPTQRYLPQRLDHQACFDTITGWIKKCEKEHKEYCKPPSTTQLPTRVIDVGSATHEASLRLHVNHTEERAAYIALSHCWGDSSIVTKLKLELVELYQEAIPERTLSKSFQDAVQITRRYVP